MFLRFFFLAPLFLIFFSFTDNLTAQINQEEEPIKCSTFEFNKPSKLVKKKDNLLIEFDSTGRPKTQCIIHSKSGLFAVHYDTTGINSVPLVDIDNNQIPDYVDSALFYLEYSYSIIIDSIGFCPPPQDSGRGGSDAWDFYLLQLGNGYYYDVAYGFTLIELEVRDSLPSVFPRYTAFSVIDNDFSPFDSAFFENGTKKPTFRETGYLGLKITLAHEFHHLIQFGYGDPSFSSFNEMTSTFIEYRLFPETRDYLQYVRSLFKNFSKYVLSENNYLNGYRYAIYLQYLQRKYGDSVVKNLWENIGKGFEPFSALDKVLKNFGSSMVSSLCDFLSWLYYSGEHYREGFLPNAQEFPKINYLDTFRFSPPSIISSRRLKPFEIRPVQFIFPTNQSMTLDDTMDILLLNIDFESASKKFSNLHSYDLMISNTPFPFSRQLFPMSYYYLCKSDSNLVVDSTFLNFGFKTFTYDFPFPNPVKFSDETIFFPVPEKASVGEMVKLTVYDTKMNEIPLPEILFPVTLYGNIRVIKVSPKYFLDKSGIFLYELSYKASKIIGKFSIIR